MIVRENLSFIRGLDPKKALHIGLIQKISKWIDEFHAKEADELGECIINDDLTITVEGRVDFRGNWENNLPEYIRFKEVIKSSDSDVTCFVSLVGENFTSLIGFPENVEGAVALSGNNLVSLEGCPKQILSSFYCESCGLHTLEGGPDYVGGNVYIGGNPGEFTEEYVRSMIPKINGIVYTIIKR